MLISSVGEPQGSYKTIGGIESYVVGDEANANKRVLWFFTDIFGHKFLNSQVLADQFAELGDFYVVIPDLFSGDAIDEAVLASKSTEDRRASFMEWAVNHTTEHVENIIEPLITAYQEIFGRPQFSAAVGYCFGAKYALRLQGFSRIVQNNKDITINSVALFHPSFLDIDEFKAIKPRSNLLLAASDDDSAYTYEFRVLTEKTLKTLGEDKEVQLKYKTILLHGVGHGFAVRGDISNPWIKQAKEGAFRDALEWFKSTEQIHE